MRLANRVIRVSGRGIVVEWARELAKDLIHMEIVDSNFDPPNHISEAAFGGLLELREVIADYLEAETGVRYDPVSEILVINGAAEAIYIAIQGLINSGDKVILPDPTYLTFEPCVMVAGGKIKGAPLIEESSWRMNLKVLEERIGARTKVIILISPNNPKRRDFIEANAYKFTQELVKKVGIVVNPSPDYGPSGKGHIRMVFGAVSM
ncbi:MAG: pyridoxal phosphate-dependent aminotransferase [candidate division WOR-3 bacterium]